MNDEASKLGWLAALKRLREQGAGLDGAPTDFADMGTAFGLDASMRPAIAAAAALGDTPAAASADADDPFERRLVRRNWA